MSDPRHIVSLLTAALAGDEPLVRQLVAEEPNPRGMLVVTASLLGQWVPTVAVSHGRNADEWLRERALALAEMVELEST